MSDGRFEVLMAIRMKDTIFGVTLKLGAAGFSEALVPICQTVASHPRSLLMKVMMIMCCI